MNMSAGIAAQERLSVPLRRHCQNCTDGLHGPRCERTVYCSPWWPCVPCECECHDPIPLRPVVPRNISPHPVFAARYRRAYETTKARYGAGFHQRVGLTGGADGRERKAARKGGLARWALDRWTMDTKGED